MSLCDVSIIMGRISVAPENSKIGVFKTGHPVFLDAVFAATINFKDRVESQKNDFVGEFWKGDDQQKVKKLLKSSLPDKAI